MEAAVSKGRIANVTPPKSVSSPWTVGANLLGSGVGCAIVFWLRPDIDGRLSALILMACVFVPGAFVEMFVSLAPETSGLDFTWRKMSFARIARKIAALWLIFALIAAGYSTFPVYAQDKFGNFHWLLDTFGLLLIVVSVPYVAVVDTFQRDPEDALASLGAQLFSLSFRPTVREWNYLLGWLVKAFFFPLMFTYLIGNMEELRKVDYESYASLQMYIYELAYNSIYFVDVLVGAVGYAATLRLLGTEIRSTEPTLLGWASALICYEPVSYAINGSYFAYGHDRPWGVLLSDHPAFYAIWGIAILLTAFVYVWATVAFGIRFSNLTHRGIITNGPYRWTKHPAYIAKNISWWMISLPFLPPDGSVITAIKLSLMLFGINVIYYVRAMTEERHLSQDPVYREYAEYIRQHGLFRFIRLPAWKHG